MNILKEMGMPRADAMELCASLGNRFVEHFAEVCEKGKDDEDFQHHCGELQAWYDKIKRIVLKQNNKHLSNIQKLDWFFTCGSSVDELFSNANVSDIYDKFVVTLLSSDETIQTILEDIL